MTEFEKYIIEHENDDVQELLLKGGRYPGIDLHLAADTIEGRKRLKNKVPQWYANAELIYPDRLCCEQCSSWATARYKATLAARILKGNAELRMDNAEPKKDNAELKSDNNEPTRDGVSESVTDERAVATKGKRGRIADLTGGLGVDAWAFASVAEGVLYNEMKPYLCEAVRHNFEALKRAETDSQRPSEGHTHCEILTSCRALEAGKAAEVLGDFHPDLIYMDPARRASDGRKVFRIEDCQPDLLSLEDELLSCSPHLLVKLSPMADITEVARRIGPQLREVHIIGSEGECKELLLWIMRGWSGGYEVVVAELGEKVSEFRFSPEEASRAKADIAEGIYPDDVLFEPGKALSKSGAFNLICEKFGMLKLGRSTHLYIRVGTDKACEGFGKTFIVTGVAALSGKTLKEWGKRFPRCEVTAKNLPLSSEALRQKLGSASGGLTHIFGTLSDSIGKILISASPIR